MYIVQYRIFRFCVAGFYQLICTGYFSNGIQEGAKYDITNAGIASKRRQPRAIFLYKLKLKTKIIVFRLMCKIGYFKYTCIAVKFAAFLIADGEYYVTNLKNALYQSIIFQIQKKKTWLEWNRLL